MRAVIGGFTQKKDGLDFAFNHPIYIEYFSDRMKELVDDRFFARKRKNIIMTKNHIMERNEKITEASPKMVT